MRWPVLLLLLLLPGCAARGPTTFTVPAGEYAKAFDSARDILRGHRFELERIDAQGGVITTQPKSTVGLATPWDREQSTLHQEFDDLFNQQRRVVRITFEPAVPTDDLTQATGPLNAQVEVVVYRL